MKKLIIISAAALLAMFCTTSCRFIRITDSFIPDGDGINVNFDVSGSKETIKGSDRETKRVFSDLGKIDVLEIDGSTDITIKQSDNTEMSLELPENLEQYLKVENDGGRCRIYLDKNYRYTNARFDIALATSGLEKLVINGAAEIEMGRMELGDLSFEINGAGDIDMHHISCGDLEIQINGAGEVDAQEMACKDIDIEINGAGDIDLGGKCDDVEVSVNGTGSIDLSRLQSSGKKNVRKSGIVSVKY